MIDQEIRSAMLQGYTAVVAVESIKPNLNRSIVFKRYDCMLLTRREQCYVNLSFLY